MLTLAHVTKSFGANKAVDDVSLTIGRGEIVGIVGENGAGKTTLMRLIAGELRADGGSVTLDGSASFVHQHFMLVNAFSIAENLALAARAPRRLFRTTRTVELEAEREIAASGIALSGVSHVSGDLSVGEKSKLELIKAIAAHPDLLILDEPTSVLTPFESDELFEVIRRVAASGTAVAFISHKLREVLAIAHRIVVMRQGRVVVESPASDMNADQLATAMVATATQEIAPSARREPPGPAVITARGLRAERITDATFDVARGEIVAIVGVAGNGQAELASMVAGLSRPAGGTLTVEAARVASIPEDRTRDGVVAEMTIAENLALTGRRWNARTAAQRARELIALYSIRAQSPRQTAGSLSGGNQQKVVLARELDTNPDAVVAAEPTRGLDLESTRFVHRQLRAAAARGAGILLITSDLDEAFAVADAIYVIYRGSLSARLTPEMARSRVAPLMAGIA